MGKYLCNAILVASPNMAITHGEHPEYPFRLSSFLSVSLLYTAFSRMIFFSPSCSRPDSCKQQVGMHPGHWKWMVVGMGVGGGWEGLTTTTTEILGGQARVWLVISSFIPCDDWYLFFWAAGSSSSPYNSEFSISHLFPFPNSSSEGKGKIIIL